MDSIYIVELVKFWLMEKKKSVVILDYKEYEKLLNISKGVEEKIAEAKNSSYKLAEMKFNKQLHHLEVENRRLREEVSYLNYSLNVSRNDCDASYEAGRSYGVRQCKVKAEDIVLNCVTKDLDEILKSIPALSFWNYFNGKADRVFCDKIRSCVSNSLKKGFSDFYNQCYLNQ